MVQKAGRARRDRQRLGPVLVIQPLQTLRHSGPQGLLDISFAEAQKHQLLVDTGHGQLNVAFTLVDLALGRIRALLEAAIQRSEEGG